MPKRYNYDLSNYIFQVGRVGRVFTLNTIPVVAGDSISVQLDGVFRTTPFRKPLIMDYRMDICAFFVPHRHVYGDDWMAEIRQPLRLTNPMAASPFDPVATDTKPTHAQGSSLPYKALLCIPFIWPGENVPKWLIDGYYRIWNRYYRPVKQGVSERNYQSYAIPTTDTYGFPAARLPRPVTQIRAKTTTNDPEGVLDQSDHDVSSEKAKVSLRKLVLDSALWGQKLSRDWFTEYYDDVMRQTFGTGVNMDADERPEFLGQKTQWSSGYDQPGTDTHTLGTAYGRVQCPISFRMPRKFFAEHGALWIMLVVRYPPIWARESHYFCTHDLHYQNLMGDPFIWSKEAPRVTRTSDYFGFASSNTELGVEPYGQWYRYHPNIISRNINQSSTNSDPNVDAFSANPPSEGFPFLQGVPASLNRVVMCQDNEYDHMYATNELQHWNISARCNVQAKRIIPPPAVMQGDNLS